MSSFLEPDKRKRIGAVSWESFTRNPFFQSIDFVALERKEILPLFVPSSEKTNFDATYDLEELLPGRSTTGSTSEEAEATSRVEE